MFSHIIVFFSIMCCYVSIGNKQSGPDPWNYDHMSTKLEDDHNVPPDLRFTVKKKVDQTDSNGMNEWFFRTTLGLLLKGGQLKTNDDNSVDILLRMKFNPERWAILEKYMMSTSPFTEEMYRQSVGYVQDAIYKPTVSEKIVLAWGEYIQVHLMEYKDYIIWTLGSIASVLAVIWLSKHISHRHLIIFVFTLTYIYEAFISYKEAEQQELKRFLDAMDSCKWKFWSSACDVPHPDLLMFLKYMNPMKIGIRMFTNLISEPMITISETVKVIIHGITDGLWFPFDKIVYGILLLIFNAFIIMLLIMIVFNYIFNISFNSTLFGLLSVEVKQRKRNLLSNKDEKTAVNNQIKNRESINDSTLNKLLDVFSKALDNKQNNAQPTPQILNVTYNNNNPTMKRSLSAGRISDFSQNKTLAIENHFRKRTNVSRTHDGSGDTYLQ